MADTPFNRTQFIQNYGKLVARTWSDPAFLEKLEKDPAGVLAAEGFHVNPGAHIRVVAMKPTGAGHASEQVDAWVHGNTTGLYNLYIPSMPHDIKTALASKKLAQSGDVNTTCTPCCCCT